MNHRSKYVRLMKDMHTQWFTHPFTKHVKKTMGDNLVVVEVGVFKGDNAKNMLSVLDVEHMYLIDPYEPYYDNSHTADEMKNLSLEIEAEAHTRLNKWNNITFIKKKAENAVHDIPDEVDVIYIDGDHSYEGVKKDIELYYPKVRKGGIIGGDDFTITHIGLIKAVIEFAEKHKLVLEGRNENWWIKK